MWVRSQGARSRDGKGVGTVPGGQIQGWEGCGYGPRGPDPGTGRVWVWSQWARSRDGKGVGVDHGRPPQASDPGKEITPPFSPGTPELRSYPLPAGQPNTTHPGPTQVLLTS